MPRHSDSKFLPYNPEQVFDLVADIAAYPEFLPWCAGARIRSREDFEDHAIIKADLIIAFKLFREKFGSKVTLWPEEGRIDTEYLDGPFKYLLSNWQIEPAEGGSKVSFFVDFEFKNRILQGVIGLMFNEAMARIIQAFEDRAEELYG